LDKPVAAAINGVAAGAGVGLALACDIRIGSEKASLVPAFVTIGLVPDSGLSWTATRLLGEARAFDWITGHRRMSAAEALDAGLVTEVVRPDQVLEGARQRCAKPADAPGDAVGMTKRLLRSAATASFDERLDLERQLQQVASEHPAYERRIAAFLEKQPAPVS
jgi:2-(1,2-epoxy-1,2-dihydrophenyl)acetyl-CoA isomerase